MKKWFIYLLLAGCLAGQGGEALLRKTVTAAGRQVRLAENIPVVPRERLRIIASARCIKGNSLESKPQFEEIFYAGNWYPVFQELFPLPSYKFEFYSADNKDVKYGGSSCRIYSNEWRNYPMEFYVPDGAAYLRMSLNAGGKDNQAEIRSLELERRDKEPYLNINPDFKFDSFSPAGWSMVRRGSMVLDPRSGRQFGIESQGWSTGALIPVTPGMKFRMKVGGIPTDDDIRFTVAYFKSSAVGEKDIARNRLPIRMRKNEREKIVNLQIPEEANWMRLGVGRGIVNYIFVETGEGQ